MNIKISVIIPIYNMEKFLNRSLDTVMNQSYTNLEVIMVDDGSTDKSADICQEYAAKDSRFLYFYKDNGGLSSARNFGLDKCTGDYIAFLDPDDYLHSDIYMKLLHALQETHAGMAFCDYRVVYGDEPYDNQPECKTEILNRHQAQNMYFEDFHNATVSTVVWNKLFPASVMKKFRFPNGRIHEDESTTYMLLYHFDCVAYVKAPYYNYFVCEGSIMNSSFNVKRFDLFKAYHERTVFYAKHEEYELCRKMFFLYIHMLCQYREWAEQSGQDFSDTYRKCFYREKKMYKKYKPVLNFSLNEKMELDLFNNAPSLYRVIWGLLKRNH